MQRSDVHYDVVIVGASVAGASLALQLGRSGVRVAIFDREQFPRRKACGEGLSSQGLRSLLRLGIDPEKEGLPSCSLSGYEITEFRPDSSRRSMAVRNPADKPILGIERFVLDARVLKAVRSENTASCFFREAVEKIGCGDGEGLTVKTDSREIACSIVVLADGARSQLSVQTGATLVRRKPLRYGLSCGYEGVFDRTPDRVVVENFLGHEVFFTPVSTTRLNVSVLAEKSAIELASSPGFWSELITHAGDLFGFRVEEHGQRLVTGPISSSRRYSGNKNVVLIGDCAETMDPIGGMGMTHALLSAELAVPYIVQMLEQPERCAKLNRDFEVTRARIARPLRGFTRLSEFAVKHGCQSERFSALTSQLINLPILSELFLPGSPITHVLGW